jgi:hypothetical protein
MTAGLADAAQDLAHATHRVVTSAADGVSHATAKGRRRLVIAQ